MIVVADTSVFLNLCRIRQEVLLSALFHQVYAPPEVKAEFLHACLRLPRFSNLTFPNWVIVRAIQQPLIVRASWAVLDPGESAALELALEIPAHAVLMDEAKGRKVAARLGVIALGVVGILIRAKAAGLLAAVAPALDMMERDARFFLSPTDRQKALSLAGEVP